MSDARPITTLLESAGARCGDFFGTSEVLDFGDADEEYRALTTGVGVADVSSRTRIEITGADRARVLHNLCTADINKLESGHGREAFITNVKGHAVGHGWIVCREDSLTFHTVAGQQSLLAHIDKYIIREDAVVTDVTETTGELLVAGPQAAATLENVLGQQPPGEMLQVAEVSLSNGFGIVQRVDLLPDCWSLTTTPEHTATLWQKLTDEGGVPCGQQAVDTLRIEHGFPHFGRDITDANLPQEIDRTDRAISFTKGCYLGQETIARLDALGHVNKTLVRLQGTGDKAPPPGTELLAEEKAVGTITSSAMSPRTDSAVALAYVRRGSNKSGVRLAWPHGELEVL